MIKVGSIENGKIEKCFYREGLIFKDEEAFLKKEGTCYVAELSDEEYTYGDFIKIAKNNEELASQLFYNVCWESPYTLYDQWLNDGEIKECDKCAKTFITEGDKDMECPCYNKNNK